MNLTLIKDPFVAPTCTPLLGGKFLWLRDAIPYFNTCGALDELPAGFVFDGYSAFIFRRYFNTIWNVAAAALHDFQYARGDDKFVADHSLVANMIAARDIDKLAPFVYGVVSVLGFFPYIDYKHFRKEDPLYVGHRFAETLVQAEAVAKGWYCE